MFGVALVPAPVPPTNDCERRRLHTCRRMAERCIGEIDLLLAVHAELKKN